MPKSPGRLASPSRRSRRCSSGRGRRSASSSRSSCFCRDAVVAIAKQVEGGLPRGEREALRAHLRRCPECAQGWLAAAALSGRCSEAIACCRPGFPLFFARASASTVGASGSGGVGIGVGGLVAKAAAIVVTGAVVGGGVSEGATRIGWPSVHHRDPYHGSVLLGPGRGDLRAVPRVQAPGLVAGGEALPSPDQAAGHPVGSARRRAWPIVGSCTERTRRSATPAASADTGVPVGSRLEASTVGPRRRATITAPGDPRMRRRAQAARPAPTARE